MPHRLSLGAALAALLLALPAPAQPTLTADVGLYSAYVVRGLSLTNRPVIQPDVVLAAPLGGTTFAIGAWANVEPLRYDGPDDISLADGGGTFDFTEVDVWVEARRRFGPAALTLGAWRFYYPNRQGATRADQTDEVYAKLALSAPLSPALSVYYDVDLMRGAYLEGGVSHAVPIGGREVTFGTAAGWSAGQAISDDPAQGYNFAEDGLTHVDLSATTTIEVGRLSVAPTLHLNFGHDAETRLCAPDRERTLKLWFGALLAWERVFGRG